MSALPPFKFPASGKYDAILDAFVTTTPTMHVQDNSRSCKSIMHKGRDPLDQNFRKFGYKIEWNRTFLEIHFENCGQPPEVVLFSGILEIPGISVPLGIITPFRPLQDLKDDGGRPFHQPYQPCFFALHDIELIE